MIIGGSKLVVTKVEWTLCCSPITNQSQAPAGQIKGQQVVVFRQTITLRKHVLWSDESVLQLFCSRLKTKRTIKTVSGIIQQRFQKLGSVMVWGFISVLGKGNSHFRDDSITAEKHIKLLEQLMLPSRPHLLQRLPGILSTRQCKTTDYTHCKGMAGKKRVHSNVLAAVLTCLQLGMCGECGNQKCKKEKPLSLAQVKSCLQEEWDKILKPWKVFQVLWKQMSVLQSGKSFTIYRQLSFLLLLFFLQHTSVMLSVTLSMHTLPLSLFSTDSYISWPLTTWAYWRTTRGVF